MDDFPSGVSSGGGVDGSQTGLSEDRLLADCHHQRAHAAGLLASLRGQALESERQSLHRFGERGRSAERSACTAIEVHGKRALARSNHNVGADVCQRQHPAAIDEDAEFRRQRPKPGLADEYRFDVARNNMRVEGCRRIVGPERARHDIASGFE